LIEGEKEFDALAVVLEGFLAVATIHRAVEGLVGLEQHARHGERIVEVGQGLARIEERLAGIEDGLGKGGKGGKDAMVMVKVP
jgi:hypothetical protein